MLKKISSYLDVRTSYVCIYLGWLLLSSFATLVGISSTAFAVITSIICYYVLLKCVPTEIPYPLLILGTLPSDLFVYPSAIIILFRYLTSTNIVLPNCLQSKLFLFLSLSAIISTIVSYITVQFLPFQTLLWSITFYLPLSTTVLRIKGLNLPKSEAIMRFFVFILTAQILPISIQILKEKSLIPGDHILGTIGANGPLGYWESVLFLSCLSLIVFYKRNKLVAKINVSYALIIFFTILSFFMMVETEAKSYVGAIAITGGLGFFLKLCAKITKGNPRALFALMIGIVLSATSVIGLFNYYFSDFSQTGSDWSQQTRKVIFLKRAFGEIEDSRFNNLFGVGPGMFGSRAANSVSSDVLYKETQNFLSNNFTTPISEKWALDGLWDQELFEFIKYTSATLIMPFSSIGAVKGELGWFGFLLLIGYILAASLQSLKQSKFDESPIKFSMGIAVFASFIGTIILSLVDLTWEHSRIMIVIGALSMSQVMNNNVNLKK